LLEAALTRENLRRAFKRVRANKGTAGVDGLDIDQTARLLATEWPGIREQLLRGIYRPSPVRQVMIPKPDGTSAS
jgi:RNA-directed DNA polymerase